MLQQRDLINLSPPTHWLDTYSSSLIDDVPNVCLICTEMVIFRGKYLLVCGRRSLLFWGSNLRKRWKWLVAQMVRVPSQYAKGAVSIPGKGTYKNQPVHAIISGTTNWCFSFSLSLFLCLSNQQIKKIKENNIFYRHVFYMLGIFTHVNSLVLSKLW